MTQRESEIREPVIHETLQLPPGYRLADADDRRHRRAVAAASEGRADRQCDARRLSGGGRAGVERGGRCRAALGLGASGRAIRCARATRRVTFWRRCWPRTVEPMGKTMPIVPIRTGKAAGGTLVRSRSDLGIGGVQERGAAASESMS